FRPAALGVRHLVRRERHLSAPHGPAPWRPAWCHGARPAVVERGAGATRRRRGGRKEACRVGLNIEKLLYINAYLTNPTLQKVRPEKTNASCRACSRCGACFSRGRLSGKYFYYRKSHC